MESINNIENKEALLQLIDRYFEAETSLEEERLLRRLLVETDCEDDAVEEARAVMGIFAVDRKIAASDKQTVASQPLRKIKRTNWAAISAVASVAIILVTVVSLLNGGKIAQSDLLSELSVARSLDSVAMPVSTYDNMDGQRELVAMASVNVNTPDSPDEIDALIKSELGLMAEAQNSIYESVLCDVAIASSVMN